MILKIKNTHNAKIDASVLLSCADSFSSLLSTMNTIKNSINDNWSDCFSKNDAIDKLDYCIYNYKKEIIPALNMLGEAIDAYALATEQLASRQGQGNGVSLVKTSFNLNGTSTTYDSPYDYVNANKLIQKKSVPDPNNKEIWLDNRYAQMGLIGQCTWFVHGRVQELYGIDPVFGGHGKEVVTDLVNAHSNMFYDSTTPVDGAIFSTVNDKGDSGHTGIILAVDGNLITYQDGNYDGYNNTFEDFFNPANPDWGTYTVTVEEFKQLMGSQVHFANPYDSVKINW